MTSAAKQEDKYTLRRSIVRVLTSSSSEALAKIALTFVLLYNLLYVQQWITNIKNMMISLIMADFH